MATPVAARLPRVTPAGWALVGAAIGLQLFARLLASNGLSLVAAGVTGLLVTAALTTPRLRGISIERHCPARVRLGAATSVHYQFQLPSRRGGLYVVTDTTPGLAPVSFTVATNSSREPTIVDEQTHAVRRGRWSEAKIRVAAGSPLGFFERRLTVTLPAELIVHPAAAMPLRVPPPSGVGTQGRRSSAGRVAHDGIDIAGLRDWRIGDPATHVHWRASAKRGRPVVMEREAPAAAPVAIAVGARGTPDQWEAAIARAAATAILLHGSQPCRHRNDGLSCQDRLLDHFAQIETRRRSTAADLDQMLQRIQPGGLCLFVSGTPAPPEILAVARRHGVHLIQTFDPDVPHPAPANHLISA